MSQCRDFVSDETIKTATQQFVALLEMQLNKKGQFAFVNNHEALGVIHEELFEVTQAVRENNDALAAGEMLDLAVAAFWAHASHLVRSNNSATGEHCKCE